jgi:CheY-like chemotaxis protein
MEKKVKHVLVIDDDPAARWLAGAAVEEAAIAEKIIFCNNGKEGISYVKENCLPTADDPHRQCPELILLDINMPVLDGFEFLEELSSIEDLRHNDTSVILLSSASYEAAKKQVNKFSILGYLEKPVMSDKLIEIVKNKYPPLEG